MKTVEGSLSKKDLNLAKSTWHHLGGFNMDQKGFPIHIKLNYGKLELSGLGDKPEMRDFCGFFQNKVMSKDKKYKFDKYSKFYYY